MACLVGSWTLFVLKHHGLAVAAHSMPGSQHASILADCLLLYIMCGHDLPTRIGAPIPLLGFHIPTWLNSSLSGSKGAASALVHTFEKLDSPLGGVGEGLPRPGRPACGLSARKGMDGYRSVARPQTCKNSRDLCSPGWWRCTHGLWMHAYTNWECMRARTGDACVHRLGMHGYTDWECMRTRTGDACVHGLGMHVNTDRGCMRTQTGDVCVQGLWIHAYMDCGCMRTRTGDAYAHMHRSAARPRT